MSLDITEGCRKVRLKELFLGVESAVPKFYKPTGYSPPIGRNNALDVLCSSVKNNSLNQISTIPIRNALLHLRKLVYDRTIRISRVAVVKQNTDIVGSKSGVL